MNLHKTENVILKSISISCNTHTHTYTPFKRLKKMWYLYTMEFYLATKKNEILSFAGKWMELELHFLSEASQVQKANSCMFSLICGVQT
jgi:hypothetical protein